VHRLRVLAASSGRAVYTLGTRQAGRPELATTHETNGSDGPDASAIEDREPGAAHGVFSPDEYAHLRRIARRHLRRHRPGATLNTTAVVHEAYLKLAGDPGRFNDQEHFFAVASTAMRQLLVDSARRRLADKRGGGAVHIALDESTIADEAGGVDVLEIDAALRALAAHDPLLERVVECRFFAGLSVDETARALGRSARSVERDWARARAYLYAAIRR
jgi:RNA polymerase sigma factor (TIGR02999 family)